MSLREFLEWLFEPRNIRFSGEVRLYLEKLARDAGDTKLADWIAASNDVYEYTVGPSGYVWPPSNGRIRIGLHRKLLNRPSSCHSKFAVGHELGHVRQFRAGQTQAPMFTVALLSQELDASSFGSQVLAPSGCRGLKWWYQCKLNHLQKALQAAYLGYFHAAVFGLVFAAGFALEWATGVAGELLDKLLALRNRLVHDGVAK